MRDHGSKRATAWKVRAALLTLMPLVTACATAPGGEGALGGFCAGLEPRVVAHADALAKDGSDAAVVTGADLIAGIDAGCGA